MASSGKKKPSKSTKPATGKGHNSRTGGSATPRAPKPREGGEERSRNGSANGGRAAKGRTKGSAAPQPRARGRRPTDRALAPASADDEQALADDTDAGGDDERDAEKEDGAAPPRRSLSDRARLGFASLMNPPTPEERKADRERKPLLTREPEPVEEPEELLEDGSRVPRWGFGDVLLAFFAALFVPIAGVLILVALGYKPTAHAPGLGGDGAALGQAVGHVAVDQAPSVVRSTEYAPVLLQFVTGQVLFWLGLMGVTAYAVIRKGNGFVKDLRLRFEWIDVPLGLAIGVACQLVLMPLVYWIVERIAPGQDVSQIARDVVDDAVDPISTILVILSTTVGAPIVEEIYYRGLVLRSGEKRFSPAVALAITSAFFALTHWHPILWPGILVFGVILGVLAQRTNRLGTPILAHVGFNLTTLVVLLLGLDLPV